MIKARGASSAGSAANAIIDSVRAATTPTPARDCFSAGVVSDRNPYDIPAGLIYSFPLRTDDARTWSIVPGFSIGDDARKRLASSAAELQSEREAVKDLLGPAV